MTEEQTISKWENALSVPDADELIHLAEILEVSVNSLLGVEEKELKALRTTTIFNMIVIGLCIVGSILTGTGMVKIGPAGEKYFAAFLVSAVLLFMGCISPKLPFTRHAGLRLPWTVADEETWGAVLMCVAVPGIISAIFYYYKFYGKNRIR